MQQNPDAAKSGADPIAHYIEHGARLGCDPSREFDSAYYLRQCLNSGEGVPANPLLHFLTVGMARGLKARAPAASNLAMPAAPSAIRKFRLNCDDLELTGAGELHAAGWAIAPSSLDSIAVLLDEEALGEATLGEARPDVAEHFAVNPERTRRFRLRVSLGRRLAAGEHTLTFCLRDRSTDQEEHAVVARVTHTGAASDAQSTGPERMLHIDVPPIEDGVARTTVSSNLSISGWGAARNGVDSIEIRVNGQVLGKAHYGIRREDVASVHPTMPGALLSGFATSISRWTLPKGDCVVEVRLLDKQGGSEAKRFQVTTGDLPETGGPWLLRRKMSRAEIDLQLRALARMNWRPRFTIVLATPADEEAATHRTLTSLQRQAYGRWQLARTTSGAFASLAAAVSTSDEPEFIVPLRAGDELGCDALLECAVMSGLRRNADFFYTDERCVDPGTKQVNAYFKPDWSPHLLLSTNYIGRLWFARRELFERSSLKIEEWERLGDYELVLRATETAERIVHISSVLCERGGAADSTEQEGRALRRALERRKIDARVEAGCVDRTYRVQRTPKNRGKVSIIIPTCAAKGFIKQCIQSLREKTTYRNFEIICVENIPLERSEWKAWLAKAADKVVNAPPSFNWSHFNNLAAEHASGDFLLFLNDDVEITEPGWLDAMLEVAADAGVGAVGPQLLYGDGTVQHAGIVLTRLGHGRHCFRTSDQDDPGYFGLARTLRDVAAVTGACLLVRRDTFDAVGRFDEAHTVVNNDVDFCLRVRERGLSVVYTPHARLVHHELASRSELPDTYDSSVYSGQWAEAYFEGDPFLNRHLSRDDDQMRPELEAVQTIYAGHPLFAKEDIRSILIVKLDHIGDCVLALPAIRQLHLDFPKARLTVLGSSGTRAVWGLEPAIAEVIEFNFFHARSGLGHVGITEQDLAALRERLQPSGFDLAVDLRKGMDTRHILRCTGAHWTAGFDRKSRFPWLDVALEWDEDIAPLPKRQHVGDGLLMLVRAIDASAVADRGVIAPANMPALSPNPLLERLFLEPVVCIHPASGTPTRQWAPERFSELADRLLARGDLHVALIGGADEQELVSSVESSIKAKDKVFNLVGAIKLAELPAFLARCRLYVGNNSGPVHFAGGVGIPTIGIYSGVVDAHEWGPMGSNALAIRRDVSCSPCYIAKPEQCPRGMACLSGLSVVDVYRQCERLLAGTTVA